ncbi:probable serine/threonine-protein kinase MARK-A [Folsomia candida]|uniref:probable serine/threonine-protein kinase MARK-A n=1 Tax=Folsomia candida TaxID=158441 RepID=UPI000B901F77|nr:probable serine/threonine-protein kinase MARK-A [Folsomia candida]
MASNWGKEIETLPPAWVNCISGGEVIGSGGYGFVKKCKLNTEHGDNQTEFAIKLTFPQTRDRTSPEFKQYLDEPGMAMALDHPNIIKTYDYNDQQQLKKDDVTLILKGANLDRLIARFKSDHDQIPVILTKMELCGPSLQEWLDKQDLVGETLSTHQVGIVEGLISAVEYLHKEKICHRDINPDNICFSWNALPDKLCCLPIKLIDFGISCKVKDSEVSHTNEKRGTQFYIAPEVYNDGKYDLRSDIYSLGFVFWEVLQYFNESSKEKNFGNLTAENHTILIEDHSVFIHAQKIISSMIQTEVSHRISTMEQVRFEKTGNKKSYTASNSEELKHFLEFGCQDGDEIKLCTGSFEGQFHVKMANVSIMGCEKVLGSSKLVGINSCIKISSGLCTLSNIVFDGGEKTMLEIDGDGNNFNSLEFIDAQNGIRCNGNKNEFHNVTFIRVHDVGMTVTGNCNKCNYFNIKDARCGFIVRGKTHEFNNVSFSRDENRIDNLIGFEFKRGEEHSVHRLTVTNLLKENKSGIGIKLSRVTKSVKISHSNFHVAEDHGENNNHEYPQSEGLLVFPKKGIRQKIN